MIHEPWFRSDLCQFPPMEDDVAPNALIEEGTHHVEKNVEDPENQYFVQSYERSPRVVSDHMKACEPWVVSDQI